MPLQLDRISCWIEAQGRTLPERSLDSLGDATIAYIEPNQDGPFAIGFAIHDREHDYAIRATIDGSFVSSRAMANTERVRTSSIEDAPGPCDFRSADVQ